MCFAVMILLIIIQELQIRKAVNYQYVEGYLKESFVGNS